MLAALRQNLTLKIISLMVSVFMYVYVQADRNPIVSRLMIAAIRTLNQPEGLEVETAQQQVEVNVTGPKMLMDHLKDSSVKALVDLRGVHSTESKPALVRINFICSTLPTEEAGKLTFESTSRSISVQLFPQVRRMMLVTPLYTQEPPAGFQYGKPELHPNRVTLTGRSERINRVEHLVVNASPNEAGAVIDGDFPIIPQDSQSRFVDNVTIIPDSVHVSVPLIELPSSRIVTVSAAILDLPLPPYKLVSVSVAPNHVKIEGKPAKVNHLFTLNTEEISVKEFTENREVEASLTAIPDVVFRDMDGHVINRVKVRITISKSAAPIVSIPTNSSATQKSVTP